MNGVAFSVSHSLDSWNHRLRACAEEPTFEPAEQSGASVLLKSVGKGGFICPDNLDS